MKFFKRMKDGGPESPVIGFFLVEIKFLFSVVLLKFGGTREAFHSHAFNALTIWLKGEVLEAVYVSDGVAEPREWKAGDIKFTPRGVMHKVIPGDKPAWALSFRGPWAKTWQEVRPNEGLVTLTHGRRVVANPLLAAPYGKAGK